MDEVMAVLAFTMCFAMFFGFVYFVTTGAFTTSLIWLSGALVWGFNAYMSSRDANA